MCLNMAPTEALSNELKEKGTTIIFNASKNEAFKLHENYKALNRKLKGSWKIVVNKDEITSEILSEASLFILPGPKEKFTENEFNCMKKYLDSGGSILVMLGEGGEKTSQTNMNFFLEEYGIMVNSDSVVRTHYYKYFHPKECLISNGVLNRAITEASGKSVSSSYEDISQGLTFVYPFGATLNVAQPAVAALSTGTVTFPLNRPVCALYTHPGSRDTNRSLQGGKLAVIGSAHVFEDRYIDKEDNDRIRDVLFKFLTTTDIRLNQIDAEDPEISDYTMVPDTAMLAEAPRLCLMEAADEVPTDYTKLFNQRLFSINTNCVAPAIRAYQQLGIKHETLRLITPQFETPMPSLQAAVFPPSFKDLPPPPLELFDLDDAFRSERSHLAQLANKCMPSDSKIDSESDLIYFIKEASRVVGLQSDIVGTDMALVAKQLLYNMCVLIMEYKERQGNERLEE